MYGLSREYKYEHRIRKPWHSSYLVEAGSDKEHMLPGILLEKSGIIKI